MYKVATPVISSKPPSLKKHGVGFLFRVPVKGVYTDYYKGYYGGLGVLGLRFGKVIMLAGLGTVLVSNFTAGIYGG